MEGNSDIKGRASALTAFGGKQSSKFTDGEIDAKQCVQGQADNKLLRPMGKPGPGLSATKPFPASRVRLDLPADPVTISRTHSVSSPGRICHCH